MPIGIAITWHPPQIITAQASTNPELTLDMDTKASDQVTSTVHDKYWDAKCKECFARSHLLWCCGQVFSSLIVNPYRTSSHHPNHQTNSMEKPNHLSIIHLRLKQWWSSSQQASHLHTSPPNTMFFAHCLCRKVSNACARVPILCLQDSWLPDARTAGCSKTRVDDFRILGYPFSLQKRMHNSAQSWHHQLYTTSIIV